MGNEPKSYNNFPTPFSSVFWTSSVALQFSISDLVCAKLKGKFRTDGLLVG